MYQSHKIGDVCAFVAQKMPMLNLKSEPFDLQPWDRFELCSRNIRNGFFGALERAWIEKRKKREKMPFFVQQKPHIRHADFAGIMMCVNGIDMVAF